MSYNDNLGWLYALGCSVPKLKVKHNEAGQLLDRSLGSLHMGHQWKVDGPLFSMLHWFFFFMLLLQLSHC
ncbi:hypothetical protein HHK36_032265 [Tetracentron sinense]|uniref:Uncharacterized protein n=1 Tax=Tetracentron sinense TaxID=13715 RepID=A0A834Y7L7_TETSI|nr:hypothetical protein HHK36_032265 [Tetracentron sinense]